MIVRHFDKCFAVEMRASALRRERINLQLDALVKSGRPLSETPSLRRHATDPQPGHSNSAPQ
jgi:hypothetical protein